jgi:hypothetical protein
MQDITPDLVTPEQLVNEILRREHQMQCPGGILMPPPLKSPSVHHHRNNELPLMKNSEEDQTHPQQQDEQCIEMESRRSSLAKAMSIDEEDESNCNSSNGSDCCNKQQQQQPGSEDGGGGGGNGNVKDSALSSSSEVVVLDCQTPSDFQESHIRGALNVTFPAIMIRRIAAGKIDIFEKSPELKSKIANSKLTFVVYDAFNPATSGLSNQNNMSAKDGGGIGPLMIGKHNSNDLSDLVNLISRKLAQSGCRVATLKGNESKM